MRLRRDAPKSENPGSSNARESAITLIRKGGYPDMRVCGRGGRTLAARPLGLTPRRVPAPR